MRKITSLAILGLAWLAGTTTAFAHDHEYANGICIYDDCTDKYEAPVLDADGYYMLYNAGNVEWLQKQVNANIINLNAKLMNDIDFEGKENLHYPIGDTAGHKYNGIFDGQGHRIMNLYMNYPTMNQVGFFGWLRGNGQNTEVRNLIMDKSCTIIGAHRVAAVSGCCQNNASGVKIILENIINEAHVIATTGTDAGGLMGGRDGNSPVFEIRNYINTGTIECKAFVDNGTQCYAGAVCGWYGDNGSNLNENIINIGQILGMPADGRAIGRMSGTVRNIVDLSGSEGATQGIVEELTAEDITSGKLAYYINSLAGNTVFYQTIGEDEYPVPFSTSKQVYLQGELKCDGTPLEGGTYTNELVTPVVPPHEYEAGNYHCVNCGAISGDFCEQVDGFYQLNNETDVCWFAEYVKAGNTTVNAKLNADLDFTEYPDFAGIADRDHGFKGIFDGGFHTISNMDMSWREAEDWVGFFNFLNGGATVKNLRGDNTCIIVAHGNAGFIGGSTAAGDIYLENLGFEGDVSCQRSGAGGILGCNTGSQAKIYMTNCYSTGFISGSEVMENGALSAWLGGDGAVITNCWSSATVSGVQNDDKYLARFNSATFTNCYSTNGTPLQCAVVDYEDVESGALCYKLNGDQSDIQWYQTIGTDEHPTFMPGHEQVYANATMSCDGSFDPNEATYSNTEGSTRPDHQFEDGFCKVCHQQDPEYPFIEAFANADHDVTTGYTTVNSGDGSGLAINNSVAEHWNMKHFETYQTITDLEPGIYRLRVQGLQRAEAWDESEGKAYETGELSEAYAPLYHSSQYFAEVNGQKIANRFMDITKEAQEESVNETESLSDNTGLYVPNSLAACRKYFAKGLYWNEPLYFFVGSANDTIKIGVDNNMYIYGNWTVWDTWRLDKVEGTVELIRQQQTEAVQAELEELEPQAALAQAYEAAKEEMENASSLEDIMKNADILSRYPNLIRQSHLAYIDFIAAIEEIKEQRAERDDLNGEYTDLLDKYLEEDEEASEELPNGTFINIKDTRMLDTEQLTAEIAFVKALFEQAIMTSISTGSDVSTVIKNAAFNEDTSFGQWVAEKTYESSAGSNFNSNSGFTDIYPVAGTWNTAFQVYQDIDADLPNGIYELQAPAFYRPGGNGQGDLDGNDYVPADLFINDWYTPVMNIYAGQVLYEDAINGVNCRYDASGDPEAPHNGETTSAQDFDTGIGYVPEQRQAVSFAFAGGRYINKVYGFVTDGKLRIGIRNTGKPWYESGMTMWGQFRLTFMGESEEAIAAMMETYAKRVENIRYNIEMGNFSISLAHLTNIEAYMSEVEAAGSYEEKVAALTKVNAEFNTIGDSYDAYKSLVSLMDFCSEKADALIETNPERSEAFTNVYDEIAEHIYACDLTDEEALNYKERILNDPALGGGYYVQGDLLDAEGNELTYGTHNEVYPMTLNEDGTYTATVTTSDRSNRANSGARAGIYISRMDESYKVNQSARRFATPEINTFTLTKGSSNDVQVVGGTFNITFNPATGETKFEAVDYKWHDNVYVVGSIMDVKGEQHRWKNDEMAPLAHKGNGIYEGKVTFYQDAKEYIISEETNDTTFYANFTIFACRSNTGSIANSTATRGNWTEGRYGSDTNKLLLGNNEPVGDLARGLDRKWYLTWGSCTETTQEYTITFDMNKGTVSASYGASLAGDVNNDNEIDVADIECVLDAIANKEASKYAATADVNGDNEIDVADIECVLSIIANK